MTPRDVTIRLAQAGAGLLVGDLVDTLGDRETYGEAEVELWVREQV